MVGGSLLLVLAIGAPGPRGELRALVRAGGARRAALILAAASVGGYQICFFAAVRLTGVAIGTVVAIGSAPVMTGLISALTGGRLDGRWMAATAAAIAGCAVLVTGGSSAGVSLPGVSLALAAGLCYAVYVVTAARLISQGAGQRAVMGALFGGAAVLLTPVLAATSARWLLTGRGLSVTIYLGVVTTAVAYLLYGRGLRTVPAPVAVTLGLAEPVVAALLAVLVLGERLTPAAAAGVGLVGLAIAVLAVARPGRELGAGPPVGDNRDVGPPQTPSPARSPEPGTTGFRSGFACFAGRPNVGKSTLLNALVGAKVAITSSRPQTTRRAIRGIVHRPDAQLIIVDTPGLHRPRTLLGERLDSLVRATLAEVDVIGFCLPATERIGPGDKYLAAGLTGIGATPVVAIVTKTDQAPREQIAAQLAAVGQLGDWADVVPVSAVARFQLDVLADVLVSHLPEGRPLYPDGGLTDEPEQRLVAELIREAILEGVRDELPHSIAVVVEEMAPREGRDDLIDVHAIMYVERPSQKAIVIGAKGARLKEVGSRARHQIEALLGTRVYLDLRIKIAKDWQRDPKQLRRLGFYD